MVRKLAIGLLILILIGLFVACLTACTKTTQTTSNPQSQITLDLTLIKNSSDTISITGEGFSFKTTTNITKQIFPTYTGGNHYIYIQQLGKQLALDSLMMKIKNNGTIIGQANGKQFLIATYKY